MAHPSLFKYDRPQFMVIDQGTKQMKLVGIYPGLDTSTGITSTGWFDRAQLAAEQYLERNPGTKKVHIMEAGYGAIIKLKFKVVQPPNSTPQV